MNVELLTPDRVAELRRASFTYADVGATAGVPPPGYHHFSSSHPLSAALDFDAAARALMTWQVQQRSGLQVSTSSAEVAPDEVAVMRLGVGPLSVAIPCRVVYVIDERHRRGFAYGTLPGHPERGEEAFVLDRAADGRVRFTVSAFSRPASLLARFGGPGTTLVQRLMTRRYLRALDS